MPPYSVPNALLYLSPSVLLAFMIHFYSRRMLVAWFIRLPGTLTHEILRAGVGFSTFAGPTSMSLLPKKEADGRWTLGGVWFRNIRWYNAALVSFAPLLCLPLCAWLVIWRMQQGQPLSVMDGLYWFLASNLLLAAWPSQGDFKLAQRSWPLIIIVVGLLAYWQSGLLNSHGSNWRQTIVANFWK